MLQSENINELVTALSKAQGEISPAIKDNVNPHFKSKYADLSSVWNACRQPLSKNGLAIIQTMGHDDKGQLQLITTLAHASGQWIRSSLPVVTNKNDAQGIGSALTYMRRYSLSAMVGIAPDEDDDGEEAMNRLKKNQSNANIKPHQVENLITVEQAKELVRILSECDPIYQKKIWATLKKAPISIETIDQLPLSLHERIKNAALKNRDQYQASLNNEENEEEVVNG